MTVLDPEHKAFWITLAVISVVFPPAGVVFGGLCYLAWIMRKLT